MGSKGGRQDHYEVLRVSPDAPDEVIRAAYRALVSKYHPDRNPGDPDAELKLKRLNAAFAVLSDTEKKRQYDELTRGPEGADTPEEPAPPRPRARPTSEAPRRSEPREREQPRHEQAPTIANMSGSGSTAAPRRTGALVGWFVVATLVCAALAGLQRNCDETRADHTGATPRTTDTAVSAPATTDAPLWQWTTQRDYRIAFPATPQPAEHSKEQTRLGVVNVTAFELERPSGVVYEVRQIDYPIGSSLSEQGGVDGALKGMAAEIHATPVLFSDQRVQIGACNARSIGAGTSKITVRFLFCMHASHGYLAMAMLPAAFNVDMSSEANAFLASFSIGSQGSPTTATQGTSQGAPQPRPSPEALCAQNALCEKCRATFGPGEECYHYLGESP